MPYAIIMDFPGGTTDDYDWVVDRMGPKGRLPAGALAHIAAPSAEGLRVCDVWESMEAFQQFAAEQIGPVTRERGLAEPTVRSFPTYRWHRESEEKPAFAQVGRLPGTDLETFQRADDQIRPDQGTWPEGLIWHVAGAEGDDVVVVDTWTSKALRDEFIGGRVVPV